jgi:hypothetical protein
MLAQSWMEANKSLPILTADKSFNPLIKEKVKSCFFNEIFPTIFGSKFIFNRGDQFLSSALHTTSVQNSGVFGSFGISTPASFTAAAKSVAVELELAPNNWPN